MPVMNSSVYLLSNHQLHHVHTLDEHCKTLLLDERCIRATMLKSMIKSRILGKP